jgi:hypothetical protein
MKIWRKRRKKVCSRAPGEDSMLLGRISPAVRRRERQDMVQRTRMATVEKVEGDNMMRDDKVIGEESIGCFDIARTKEP